MRLALAVATTLACMLLAAGCSRGGAPERGAGDLDTVDVSAKPDAQASLAGDVVAQPVGLPAGGIAGALPADFPREVPLPSPSSLVDFAASARETSVTLAIDLPPEQVSASYRRQLAAAGFREQPDGAFAAAGRSLRFAVSAEHGASRLTVRVARP